MNSGQSSNETEKGAETLENTPLEKRVGNQAVDRSKILENNFNKLIEPNN